MQRRIALLGISVLVGSILVGSPAAAATPSDFAAMRAAYAASFDGGDSYSTSDPDLQARLGKISEEATPLWSSLDTTPTRQYLWSDLQSSSTQSEYIQVNYARLNSLAVAYSTRGTTLYGNAALLSDIVSALDWIYGHWYNPTIVQTNNWYPWQIGAPLSLNTSTILLYDHLTGTQRSNYMSAVDHFAPGITYPGGANRAWQSWIELTRGLILDDEATLLQGRDAIPALLVDSTCAPVGGLLSCQAPGFYDDGSYIEHDYFGYSTGYGIGAIDVTSRLVSWLSGTPWEIPVSQTDNLAKWVIRGYVPMLYRGVVPQGTNGRNLARNTVDSHTMAVQVLAVVLRVAKTAGGPNAALLKTAAKASITGSSPSNEFFTLATLPAVLDAKSIMSDSAVPSTNGSIFRHYAVMDRSVQKRPGYQFGLSLYSPRTKTYESIIGENLRGWHQSDGMTTLHVGDDLSQYSNHYWPTIDSYRLPGTTVLQATSRPSITNSANFAGGVELGGYGSSAMIMGGTSSSPLAQKSWFMFDDEIVALGTGITSTSGKPVETVVDNRRLSAAGTDALVINGSAQPTSPFSNPSMPSVNWAYLAGQTPTGGIGYTFPTATTLAVKRESRSGKWKDINNAVPYNDPMARTNTFASLGIPHGTNPASAGYAYVLLPGASQAQTSAYAGAPETVILSQDNEVHAVKDNSLNTVGAQFFVDGAHKVSVSANYPDYLAADRKSSVMVQQSSGKLSIAVADPTFAATGFITVEVKSATASVLSADPGVTVVQNSPSTIIRVDVTNSRGATRDITLSQ